MEVLLYLHRYPNKPGWWSRWNPSNGGLPCAIHVGPKGFERYKGRLPAHGTLYAFLGTRVNSKGG